MTALNNEKFIEYLDQRWRAFVEGEGNVDCQACRGCCRAGYAIGLSPAEAAVIPHQVLDGHAVVMPLEDGTCPFLIDERCSIYEKRPVSCRQFDCRDFAMASLRINVSMGGNKNQEKGVTEINASIERFHKENGKLASTLMSETAADLVQTRQLSAVVAGQHALLTTMLEYFPKAKGKVLFYLLTGPDEAARGKAMEAVDRVREAGRRT